ncbi:hypothetical protein GCM10009001_26540 [Virgibacillus siamensis]|uniref:DUF4179 domain-containing protein n=1 Tax=Virgibacillus siamensis TaxID=480071 RepID=A0ABN1GB82_9BACI
MRDDFKKDINRIKVPEEKLDLAVERAIKRAKKKHWSPAKKVTYICSAAVIVFGLLVASAFISPTMAKVMANVPYLDQIIESMEQTENRKEDLQSFYKNVSETLAGSDDYEGISGVSMSTFFPTEPPTLLVRVEDKQYKNEYENEINDVIKELAETHNIDDVGVNIKVWEPEISKKDKKQMEHSRKLLDITQNVLEQNGYSFSALGMDPRKHSISIEMEGQGQVSDKMKAEIGKLVHHAIDAKMNMDYTIEVSGKSKAEIRDENWQPIFSTVMAEAHKEYNAVTGFAYSFHPKPLEIILKTSLSQGEADKKKAEKIATYAKQVVEVKRNKLSVDKIPYEMIIRDKDQEKLFKIRVK